MCITYCMLSFHYYYSYLWSSQLLQRPWSSCCSNAASFPWCQGSQRRRWRGRVGVLMSDLTPQRGLVLESFSEVWWHMLISALIVQIYIIYIHAYIYILHEVNRVITCCFPRMFVACRFFAGRLLMQSIFLTLGFRSFKQPTKILGVDNPRKSHGFFHA